MVVLSLLAPSSSGSEEPATGVRGDSNTAGVYGTSDSGSGVVGTSTSGFGVAGNTKSGTGVYGDNRNSNTTGHAGYFNGRVNVTGNLNANNLPGAKAKQVHDTSPGGTIIATCDACRDIDVDNLTIYVPADGVLFVSAFVNIRQASTSSLIVDFSLRDIADTVLTLVTAQTSAGAAPTQVTPHLSWVLPVTAGPMTVKTHIHDQNGPQTSFFDHNLSVVYLPKQY